MKAMKLIKRKVYRNHGQGWGLISICEGAETKFKVGSDNMLCTPRIGAVAIVVAMI